MPSQWLKEKFRLQLLPNEQTIPRIHLIGTLTIVLVLTVALGGFFSLQSLNEQRKTTDQIREVATRQVQERLVAEIQSAEDFIAFNRSRAEGELKADLADQVDMAFQIVETIYNQESKRRSAEEIKKLIAEALRPIRFYGGRGYFFIDDMKGKFILLPINPQFEGKTILDNKDDTGHFIMRGLIDAARKPRGEGYSRYRWYSPDNPKEMSDKIAYVRHFAPFDWLIGTGDYAYKWEQLLQEEAIDRLRSVRFADGGYLALLGRDGKAILSPSKPQLEGVFVGEMAGLERQSSEKILELGRKGGGFLSYEWVNPKTNGVVKKTSLIKAIQPMGWFLIATSFDDELDSIISQETKANESKNHLLKMNFLLITCGVLIFGFLASWGFSRWMRQLFLSYHRLNKSQQQALETQAEQLRQAEQHYRTLANGGSTLIWTSGVDKLCN